MSLYLGHDPGISGALAVVDHKGQLRAAVDMPLAYGLIAPGQTADLIVPWNTPALVVAAVERVHSMPRQGVASTFKFGQAYGTVLGVLGALGIPVEHPTPQTWKKHHGLIGEEKDAARLLAIELWPDKAELFRRKKDCGRADAALIALWAQQTHERSR